jgi:peptidoglycan/LPS O-acetylase OafA/YrhL
MNLKHERFVARSRNNFLKGLAIIAVVIIHFLAAFPDSLYLDSTFSWWSIPLQQFLRFCVPVFIALSGFGLAKKYTGRTVSWREFISRRVIRLLPLYLLWSVILWLSFQVYPSWQIMPPESLWKQLLRGSVDYQLYFVPLILQLYLLFLFLHRLSKHQLLLTLTFTGLIQGGLTLVSQSAVLDPLAWPTWLSNDQTLYRLGISWWFYLVLGVALARVPLTKFAQKLCSLLGGITLLIGLGWAILNSRSILADTGQVIGATGFLRLPIFFYSSGFIIWGLTRSSLKTPAILRTLYRSITKAGQHSYLIFLAHTLALRILFGLVWKPIPLTAWLLGTGLLIAGVVISLIPWSAVHPKRI